MLGPNFASPGWKSPLNRLRCFNEEVPLYNIFYLSVQLIALFYKYWFLLIFVSIIIIIIIIIIMSFNKDKHIHSDTDNNLIFIDLDTLTEVTTYDQRCPI